MRTPDYTGQFKRDYKREAKGQHRTTLDTDLHSIFSCLLADQPLAPQYRDHALVGEWKDHRDCHIKPDLVLIYQKPDADSLRLGSHQMVLECIDLKEICTWNFLFKNGAIVQQYACPRNC